MSTNLRPKVKFVYGENICMDLKGIFDFHKECKKKYYCPDEDIH